ncbi:DUF1090 domain-containing protein [Ralstonia sp. 25C]|uniref:DUF1090 domain-containing protein n=1 Tax=Ralstonia sp. 25C TaxID=3447363 RepID=UPI003F74DB41
MKKTLLTAIAPLTLLAAPSAFADSVDCATKVRAIEAQITEAQQYGNANRVAGLRTALAKAKTNCSNAGLVDQAERKVREAQEDVDKAQADVRAAQDKLRDARYDGNTKKIRKAERNLSDKQRKLREKTEDLRTAEADRAAVKG